MFKGIKVTRGKCNSGSHPYSRNALCVYALHSFQHTTIYKNNRSKLSQLEQDNPRKLESLFPVGSPTDMYTFNKLK